MMSVTAAGEQIKSKEYFSRYPDDDYPNKVLLLGNNYNPKIKDRQRLVEKPENNFAIKKHYFKDLARGLFLFLGRSKWVATPLGYPSTGQLHRLSPKLEIS